MTTANDPVAIRLEEADDERLERIYDELNTCAGFMASVRDRDVNTKLMNRISAELHRRRDEREAACAREVEAARARVAALKTKPLPPRRPKRPRVAAIAGPGASHYLTT